MRLYEFKMRLKYKCDVHRKKYEEIDEAYTSKTCTKCGFLNNNLGSKKILKCENVNCNYKKNRDVCGARNIMINKIY